MIKNTIVFYLVLIFVHSVPALGQDTIHASAYTIVEQMPSFPGGEEKLVKFLQKNIRYPAHARENDITGTVFITFVVDTDGALTDIRALRGVAADTIHELTDESVRVINAMPKWIPRKQSGKLVRVQYNLPIRFSLQGNKPKETTTGNYYEEGNKYFKAGDYWPAITAYDKAVSINKNNGNAYYNRGICYLRVQKVEDACNDFKSALSLGDQDAQALLDKYCK